MKSACKFIPGKAYVLFIEAFACILISLFAISCDSKYGINITTKGDGVVTIAPDNEKFPSGSTVILAATPDPDGEFLNWEGDVTGSDNPKTITIDSTKNVVAVFRPVYLFDGQVKFTDWPSQVVSKGEYALFTVEINLPEGIVYQLWIRINNDTYEGPGNTYSFSGSTVLAFDEEEIERGARPITYLDNEFVDFAIGSVTSWFLQVNTFDGENQAPFRQEDFYYPVVWE